MKSKTFKWPPKSKNPTLESIKATSPKENWNTINYSRFIGPFDVKDERLPKSQITSVPRDEDEESDEDAEKILKPHNIQKSFQKPPTHYIPKSKNKEFTSEVAACVSKSFNDSEENNNLKKVSGSPPLEYGDFFSQDPLLAMKQSEPTNNNVESDNETYDISKILDDPNNMDQISSQQNELNSFQLDNDRIVLPLKNKPIIRSIVETKLSLPLTVNTLKQISGTSPDKNSAYLQNNRRTHEHHELCCAPCRMDIQPIKKAMNSIYVLVLDMSEGPRDDTNNFALNLPITTEKELKDVEILLK